MRVYTVGHSNRSLDEFLEVLRDNGVRQLADVRRWPRSRRRPHFSEGNLSAGLVSATRLRRLCRPTNCVGFIDASRLRAFA
jgi:uncharacterized protein (DUF488 family)